MEEAIVYKVTNKIDNKIYIGITTQKLKTRKRQHEYLSKNKLDNTLFHVSMLEYGFDNFEWTILEKCSYSEMENKEKYYIIYYNSYALNGMGYNLTKGGLYVFGSSGKYHYLNKMTPIEKENWIENNLKGINNGMYNNGHIVSGDKHFSKNLTIEEREKWLYNISINNYQKTMTKEQLKDKCWINKLTVEEKERWIEKNLKGDNNPFSKKYTKYYVITFPNEEEYVIQISKFCRTYNDVKLIPVGLYSVSNNLYPKYKGFKCRLYNKLTDEHFLTNQYFNIFR